MTPSNTQLSIIYIFPHTLSFAILYHVFQNYSSCLSTTLEKSHTDGNVILLTYALSTSSTTHLYFSMAVWNCQSAVNKADFISAFSLKSTLSILDLTETWIRPEDSATQAALSNNFSFSHIPSSSSLGWGHWSAHFK